MKQAKFTLLMLFISLLLMSGLFGDSSFLVFHLPSWLMGIGIAIDVFLATISQFQDRELSFWNWTLPICATHIGFPAFGYGVMYFLTTEYPWLRPILGTFAFLMVFAFVYEVICDSAGKEPVWGISTWLSDLIGFDEKDTRRIIAILAVSWDALWSGPAKAAQATAGHWNTFEVIGSFVIAGIVVAMVAQVALIFALKLQARKFHDAKKMAAWGFKGTIVELSVIGGFGVLSLLGGWEITESIWISILIAGILVSITFWLLKDEIRNTKLEEANEAIEAEAT